MVVNTLPSDADESSNSVDFSSLLKFKNSLDAIDCSIRTG